MTLGRPDLMKSKPPNFSELYHSALHAHLKLGRAATLDSARAVGAEALLSGLKTLDLARLHEHTLVMEVLPNCPPKLRASTLKSAGAFFAESVSSLEKRDKRGKPIAEGELKKVIATLSRHTVDLALLNVKLGREITRRKDVEATLLKSERHYAESLARSDRLKEQLRRLSRQILSAQEDERKKISRELHDVVAQALSGINVRLSTLKREALLNTKGLSRNITLTQRLVKNSTDLVQKFARELRPTALDDLGLVPALHSYMKGFTEQTGVRAHLISYAEVEQLDTVRRTILFRVAQEALTNVSRHAHASKVEVTIKKLSDGISLVIADDGKSFNVDQVFPHRGNRRLGLLGMRERLEMVDGSLQLNSSPGQGTTVTAIIPLRKPIRKRAGDTMPLATL